MSILLGRFVDVAGGMCALCSKQSVVLASISTLCPYIGSNTLTSNWNVRAQTRSGV